MLRLVALWVVGSAPLALLAGRMTHFTDNDLVAEVEAYLRRRRRRSLHGAVGVLASTLVVGVLIAGTTEAAHQMPAVRVMARWALDAVDPTTTTTNPPAPRRAPSAAGDLPVAANEATGTEAQVAPTTAFSEDAPVAEEPTDQAVTASPQPDEQEIVVPDTGSARRRRDADRPTTTTTQPDADSEPTTTTTEPPATTTTTEPEPTTTTSTTAPPPEESTPGETDGGGN